MEKQFDVLWDKYPKKIGKAEALKCYNEAIQEGYSFDVINQGLDNYIKYIDLNGIEKEYIKKEQRGLVTIVGKMNMMTIYLIFNPPIATLIIINQ